MKIIKAIFINLFFILFFNVMLPAQPIPVELMTGNKYGAINLAFSRNFSQNSRLGFFHMDTVQFDYKDENRNSFILQDLIYVETFKNLRVAGGIAYSKGGFNPTAGLPYVFSGEQFIIMHLNQTL